LSNCCKVDLGNYNYEGRGLSSISNEDLEYQTLINKREIQQGPFDSPIVYPICILYKEAALSMRQNY